MTDKSSDLGKILKRQRLLNDLTLHELSADSGVSASHLGRIERGERFPSARILRKISRPLGLTESELFNFAGYLPSQPSPGAEESSGVRLDPLVAALLSQEPVEIQRAVIGILSILKSIAKASAE